MSIRSGIPFLEHLRAKGIETLAQDLVVSCHGNTAYSLEAARQMQALADDNHRILAIEAGGLYFARPSLEAANMPSVPVISIPLVGAYEGLDAFLAPNVPSGIAAIAGVGVGNYTAAAELAVALLRKDIPRGVCLVNGTEKLRKKLAEFYVPETGPGEDALRVAVIDVSKDGTIDDKALRAFDEQGGGVFTLARYDRIVTAMELFALAGRLERSAYVRGEENLAVWSAKALSAGSQATRDALLKAAEKKAASYTCPNITLDSFA